MKPVEVVRAWFAALNAVDADALVELADPGVRLITPRGVLEGHDGVRTFAERQTYGVRMHAVNLRTTEGEDGTVITEDRLEFRSVDDDSVMGSEVMSARWVVRDGRLVEFAPHEGDVPA